MHNVATLTVKLRRGIILTTVRTKGARMYYTHIVRSSRREETCTRDMIVDWKELRSLRSLPDRHVADPETVEAHVRYGQVPSRPACVLTGLRQASPANCFAEMLVSLPTLHKKNRDSD